MKQAFRLLELIGEVDEQLVEASLRKPNKKHKINPWPYLIAAVLALALIGGGTAFLRWGGNVIHGQDAGQVDGLRILWNQLASRQGKSEALINWLNANPLITPNTNKVHTAKSSFQQQVPQRPDLQQERVKKYPNGLPRCYRGNSQGGPQNPPMAQSYMGAPQQPMAPMQVGMPPVGWPQPQMVPNMAWQQPMMCPQYVMVPQQQFLPQYGWQQQPFVGGFSQNPEQNPPKKF